MLKCTFCHYSLRAGQTVMDSAQSLQSQPAMACCQRSLLLRRQEETTWSIQWPVDLVKLSWVHPLYQIWEMLQKLASLQCLSRHTSNAVSISSSLAVSSSSFHRFHMNPCCLSSTSPLISCSTDFQGRSWHFMMRWYLLQGNFQAGWRIPC